MFPDLIARKIGKPQYERAASPRRITSWIKIFPGISARRSRGEECARAVSLTVCK